MTMKAEIVGLAAVAVLVIVVTFALTPIMTDEDIVVFSLSIPTAFGLSWLILRWLRKNKYGPYADIPEPPTRKVQ